MLSFLPTGAYVLFFPHNFCYNYGMHNAAYTPVYVTSQKKTNITAESKTTATSSTGNGTEFHFFETASDNAVANRLFIGF